MVNRNVTWFPQAEVRGVLNAFKHAAQDGGDLINIEFIAVPPRGEGLGGVFEALGGRGGKNGEEREEGSEKMIRESRIYALLSTMSSPISTSS
jgi:hypothetical protein